MANIILLSVHKARRPGRLSVDLWPRSGAGKQSARGLLSMHGAGNRFIHVDQLVHIDLCIGGNYGRERDEELCS